MTVAVCDTAAVATESWVASHAEIIRIFYDAGVDITWIDLHCDLNGASGRASPDAHGLSLKNGYFMIVIAPDPLPNWRSPDAMGLAPTRTGPYPRAYVFYKLVLAFVESFRTVESRNSAIGIILGHAIAHELGHLLLPGNGHGSGIMRHSWGYTEWEQAFSGTLMFHPDHSRLIQNRLRSN